MKVLKMLVLAIASTFCVASNVFAQTYYPQPGVQITYGEAREVESAPVITANSPVSNPPAADPTALGQNVASSPPVVTYSPVTNAPVTNAPVYSQSAPVVAYYPVQPGAAPVVTYRPSAPGAVINYRPFIQATQVDLSPRPVLSYRPVFGGVAPVAAYRPVAAAPVVTYQPVYPGAAPAYPVAAGYPAAGYPVGPTVIVRPKVYVSGQPIRNILRAITP